MWKPLIPAVAAVFFASVQLPFWLQLLFSGIFLLPCIYYKAPWGVVIFVIFFVMTRLGSEPSEFVADHLTGKPLSLSGQVVGLPRTKDHATRFDFAPEPGSELPERIRLSWYGGPELKPGMWLELHIKVRQPRNYGSIGVFDYEGYLRRIGIGAVGYVRKGQVIAEASESFTFDSVRWQVREYLQRVLPAGSVGLVSALLIGDHSLLSSAQWDMLQGTGTIHLFIVSGLHVGLAAMVGGYLGYLFFLLLSSSRLVSAPACKSIGAILVALIYAGLSGFGVPVQRALIMLLCGVGAYWFGLRPHPGTIILFAFLGVVVASPLWWLDQGLWLSFAAVAALVIAFSYRVGPKQPYWHQLVLSQCVILLALSPFLLFFDKPISLLAPLLNLVLIPAAGVLLLPGLLLTALAALLNIPGVDWLWLGWGELFLLLEWGLAKAAALDWLLTAQVVSYSLFAIGLAGVVMLLVPGRLFWGASLCCFIPFFWSEKSLLAEGGVRVAFLDVGQGLAVLVSTRDHHLLFDTGDRYGDFVVADAVIRPFLHHHGVDSLDRLVISHKDRDHSGGMASIKSKLQPERILTGYGLGESCHKEPPWEWGGVFFRFLSIGTKARSENDRSCVLLIEQDDMRILLTGDITTNAETQLLDAFADEVDVDLLQVPHHGSQTSSSADFLQQTSPRWSVISSGFRNRFGHPHPEVVKRLENVDSEVLNTALSGTLVFVSEPGQSIRVNHYRSE